VYYLSLDDTKFTWDPRKAASNERKHGVTFDEAATVFADIRAYYEEDRGADELRVAVIGYSAVSRLLFVVFIEVEDDAVRIISARRAGRHERKKYEKSQDKA
jgi:uncharacterized DUF497 family protein